jgi:hypothetical protein
MEGFHFNSIFLALKPLRATADAVREAVIKPIPGPSLKAKGRVKDMSQIYLPLPLRGDVMSKANDRGVKKI